MTWNGLTSFYGSDLWTDGENVYYSKDEEQYILKENNTWEAITWNIDVDAHESIYASRIWTDGESIYSYYYRHGSSDVTYIEYNKQTHMWDEKTWYGVENFVISEGENIWTDGINIYYSNGNTYVLNKR